MFQDFANRKVEDYLKILEFTDNRITLNRIHHSSLPPYIISFIDNYVSNDFAPIEKPGLSEILRKALIFNINYLIRPKYSMMRFLFGDYETRPVELIKERLQYFQFYGYYITQVDEFININSLEVISSAQIERVIDEVNKKVYEEISEKTGSDIHRMNLVKLLYYFFHDLGDNNPINIKLPRKILSVFFADKGFNDFKLRVDNFFSDEIFIQEAIGIMNPPPSKSKKAKSGEDNTEDKVKEILSKAKSGIISRESSKTEIAKILPAEESTGVDIDTVDINELTVKPEELPVIDKKKLVVDENIYSDDLVFESSFGDLTQPVTVTEDEKRAKLIEDLFCEQTYRRKIVKKLFGKEEKKFKTFLNSVLSQSCWSDATMLLENHFNRNKINFYSDEAVKFVDILQSYFVKDNDVNSRAV
jgi:hypothetical protein